MERKKLTRKTRTSPVTSEEFARDEQVRQKIQGEFPPVESASQVSGGLSEFLKQAIQSSDKSVYQICKDAGVSQIVVSRFLSGERDIRLATADRLAKALGLTVAKP
ncbi:helix-turn-helix domain-containing protein [Anatilimnocola floriformis]|uniref:helix-turn-helix domain-containing protein n=1 Tax=Anatilimnocola floriformis TaxID=2948575 RepID=UPI0020C438A3|nr:helix-turn-helix transcriptional regulator [Anatilimnocola floriformis]